MDDSLPMKKFILAIFISAAIIISAWIILTFWVERDGKSNMWQMGNRDSAENILLVYDPDPIYNLDEQVCNAFGRAFAEKGVHVFICTVAAARQLKPGSYDLYVFCANTYNWRPDKSISRFIENGVMIKNKSVVAITLGSGSTASSQKILEHLIRNKEGILIDSRSFWLLKPNDESRMQESNVKVAVSMAYLWAKEIELVFHKYKNGKEPIISIKGQN